MVERRAATTSIAMDGGATIVRVRRAPRPAASVTGVPIAVRRASGAASTDRSAAATVARRAKAAGRAANRADQPCVW